MAISFVEDIVQEYYRLKDYIVLRGVKYRAGKNWSDVDIVAIKGDELRIVECKGGFATQRGAKKDASKFMLNFKNSLKFLQRKYPELKDKKEKFVFIADNEVKELNKILVQEGVEVIMLSELMLDFLNLLNERYGKNKGNLVGKEDNPLTRTLIFLIRSEFIKGFGK